MVSNQSMDLNDSAFEPEGYINVLKNCSYHNIITPKDRLYKLIVKLPQDNIDFFKRLYGIGGVSLAEIIHEMPDDKVSRAIDQCEKTLLIPSVRREIKIDNILNYV